MIGIDTTFLVQLEVQEAPAHLAAHQCLRREVLDPATPIALAPQILTEFIHIVTDPRRFKQPLTIQQALDKAVFWWNAAEVRHIHSTGESTTLFLDWMRLHQLGRKRILDTQLAAMLWRAGVRRLLTSNPADFQIFGFELLVP